VDGEEDGEHVEYDVGYGDSNVEITRVDASFRHGRVPEGLDRVASEDCRSRLVSYITLIEQRPSSLYLSGGYVILTANNNHCNAPSCQHGADAISTPSDDFRRREDAVVHGKHSHF
jgi:hypothetical protein